MLYLVENWKLGANIIHILSFAGMLLIISMIIVSPELNSGRDTAIQMSVRRTLYFLSVTFVRNHMPYLVDICYVGDARAEGVHAEF